MLCRVGANLVFAPTFINNSNKHPKDCFLPRFLRKLAVRESFFLCTFVLRKRLLNRTWKLLFI